MYSLIGLSIVLLMWAIVSITDSLIQVEAKKHGADTKNNNYSLFPSLKGFGGSQGSSSIGGDPLIKLKKGFDIKLVGKADPKIISKGSVLRFAVRPPDFRGISPIPKLMVAEGDEVKAGEPIFFDKLNPEIKYAAPVSGEIVEVRRGQKRAITDVVILADKEMQYHVYDVPSLDADRTVLVDFLCATGGWTMINQRPFDIVPDRTVTPKNIFISTFNTTPLAPDNNLKVAGKEAQFQKGLEVLSKLTDGKVHVGLDGNNVSSVPDAFRNAEGVSKHWFKGPHPAGNVGIQIHHIAPINNGDTVWTLDVDGVITIGELFTSGKFDAERLVAITGAEVKNPSYIRTYAGANVGDLLREQLDEDQHVRIINGDILTGRKVSKDTFLSFDTSHITVAKEGDYYEMFGWLLPLKPRPSISRTFPNFLFKNHKFEADTNAHGERRAFVVTGQYESVLPMNLYPQHILKAIMTNDFEKMEGLGLAELSEEDVALCEFVCTSKTPVQNILRQGLDMLRDQS